MDRAPDRFRSMLLMLPSLSLSLPNMFFLFPVVFVANWQRCPSSSLFILFQRWSRLKTTSFGQQFVALHCCWVFSFLTCGQDRHALVIWETWWHNREGRQPLSGIVGSYPFDEQKYLTCWNAECWPALSPSLQILFK